MNTYEITFIVDPVLSGDEIKSTAKTYSDLLTNEGSTIVHTDEMGLKQLAYPINKRNSGVYYCYEYTTENSSIVAKMELALKRDERIMRYLTIKLDRYGVKYNDDKRNGLIGKKERPSRDNNRSKSPQKALRNDLTKIEGIGPKIAQLLNGAGILSFQDLAKSNIDTVKAILAKAGGSYELHDPATWGPQAELASEAKWNELHRLQQTLSGGVEKEEKTKVEEKAKGEEE